jgi:peptide/nickel transport system substrate-binding protein
MRKWIALILAGVLCLGLCACGEEVPVVEETPAPAPTRKPEQVREFALSYDPMADMDPITGDSQVNRMLTSLVYEPLFRLDEHFEPQPMLAQGAEVDESGLTWTITLKEGVVFSDGTPLEAKHVVSSLKKAQKSTLYAGRLRDVESIKSKGGAVVITLKTPNGGLPALLDIPVVMESEEIAPLGTGYYRYVQGENDLCLKQNNHREGEMPIAVIPLYPVTDTNARIQAFDSGLTSVVVTDFSSPYSLGYSGNYEIWDYDTTDLVYIGFKTVESPCESPMVRQAFAKAFDRDAIVSDILEGHAVTAELPVHPMHKTWRNSTAGMLGYNAETAADLLTQEGYTRKDDGLLYKKKTVLAVTLIVNSDNSAKIAIAEQLAEELTALGVSVTVSKLSWHDYTAALVAGNYDLYIGEVRLGGDFDVTELLFGSLNYGGYQSEVVQAAAEQWRASGKTVDAWALWKELVQEVPIAPLCFKKESLLITWGMGIRPTPLREDLFFGIEQWPVRSVG